MTEAAADWLGNERSAHSLALTRSARQAGGLGGWRAGGGPQAGHNCPGRHTLASRLNCFNVSYKNQYSNLQKGLKARIILYVVKLIFS